MANVDVVKLLQESFELFSAHWKEVALPLAIIIIPQVLLQLFMTYLRLSNAFADASPHMNSMFAAAMAGDTTSLSSVGLGLVFAIVGLSVIVGLLGSLVQFYVAEHFYEILQKRKATQDWVGKMTRYLIKTIIMIPITLVLIALLLGAIWLPMLLAPSGGVAILSLFLLGIFMLALIPVAFLLTLFWVFFYLENRKLVESAKMSYSIVSKNLGAFAVFFAIVIAVGIALGVVSILTCCLSFIVQPILMTIFGVIIYIAQMKLRLLLGPKPNYKL